MRKVKNFIGIILAISAFLINYSKPVITYADVPDEIIVREGQSLNLDFGLPVKYHYDNDNSNLKISTSEDNLVLGNSTIASIEATNVSSTEVYYRVFGILPSKKLDIVTVDSDQVILGGQSIGIILQCDGVLVVGFSQVINMDAVTVSPAKSSGVQVGDFITSVNGVKVDSAMHLGHIIKTSKGEELNVTVNRNDKDVDLKVLPEKDRQDKEYHIGVWGRDSSSGIGTLTYLIPNSKDFAALGHAISDVDSGKILSVREGDIYKSKIVEISKGTPGAPGEIKGEFILEVDKIGEIENNCSFGLYGNIRSKDINQYGELIQVAQNSEVLESEATIYTTIDNEGVKGYSCEISRIDLNSTEYNKNFIVTITDEELLNRTGGIVQGMSGSPIVQNGKLIGAVTHVFVNNPASGHGIFISSMINQSKGDS